MMAARTTAAALPRRPVVNVRTVCIDRLLTPASIENESVAAVVTFRPIGISATAANAVNAVEVAEQDLRRIARIGEAVVGLRQILLRYRAHDVGRHQHHQLGAL